MNRSKARGTAAETAVVAWLQAHGFPAAERRALNGSSDRGDIAGIPRTCLEVKSCNKTELAAWLDEATREAVNAHATTTAVVHKRRGRTDPGTWYVTCDLATFTNLLRRSL